MVKTIVSDKHNFKQKPHFVLRPFSICLNYVKSYLPNLINYRHFPLTLLLRSLKHYI